MNDMLKGFIKACVILLIIFCVWYFVSYKVWESKNFDDEYNYLKYYDEDEYNQVTAGDKVDLNIAKKIYDKVNFKNVNENFGNEYFSLYFGSKYLSIDELPDEFLVYLAVVDLEKDSFLLECNTTRSINASIVDSKIKEIFGNINYEEKSFKSIDGSLEINYDKGSNTYFVTNKKCSGVLFGASHIRTEMYDVKARGNFLEIYEYVYYLEYIKNKDGSYNINYYDSLDNKGNVIAVNKLDDIDKKKFSKYKFTFVKKNGNYCFEEYEKLF